MHNRILGNVLLTRQILFVQLQKQTCTQHVYHEAYLKVGESSDNINLRQKHNETMEKEQEIIFSLPCVYYKYYSLLTRLLKCLKHVETLRVETQLTYFSYAKQNSLKHDNNIANVARY